MSAWLPDGRRLLSLAMATSEQRHRQARSSSGVIRVVCSASVPILALVAVYRSATGANPIFILWGTAIAAFVWALVLLRSAPVRGYIVESKGRVLFQASCWFIVASVATTDWPLRVSFVASRPRLETLAAKAANHGQLTAPARAGLFVVRRVEVNHKDWTCLWLDLNRNGRAGLARASAIDTSTPYLATSVRLGEGWALITEE